MRDFRKIQVWDRAHEFTLQVYKITSTFPKDELYGLTSQMRRSAVSIPSNIAEGCGRDTQAELARFVHILIPLGSDYHGWQRHTMYMRTYVLSGNPNCGMII